MAKAKSPIPEGYHTVTPQLTLDNAAQTIEWYKKALGAKEEGRAVGPDGKIMHASLRIGDSSVMMNHAMGGSKTANTLGRSPMPLLVVEEDVDALYTRTGAAGANVAPV